MLRQSTDQAFASGRRDAWHTGLASRVPARLLVFAGVLMFVLYIFMDVVASLAYDGYSYKDQTISELSAIGAPTRTFWLVAGVFHGLLSFAFAFGVLAIAGNRRKVRVVGWLLLIFAASGFLWWFAPMHQREVLAADGGTWQDTLHLVTGGISSILFFSMIGVGAFAFGRRFRWYSFATIGLMLVFGMLMNMDVEKVGNNEPTPWLGIWERIAIEGAMLWEAVFAAVLLWRGRVLRGQRG
jgi:hypothetical protein